MRTIRRIKKIFFLWNIVRMIQLILGIVLAIAFISTSEIFYLIIGGFLILIALFHLSPCGQSCSVSTGKNVGERGK